ncbi:MAG: zf-HC2 domain-containing protein [bacterium]|nr:zf-HC2 domain-containing protein [bacterium]
MDCKTARHKMLMLLDGELPQAQACRFNEHLVSCAACRAELAVYKETIEALDTWPCIEPAFTLAQVKKRNVERNASCWRVAGFFKLPAAPRWALASGLALSIIMGSIGGIQLDKMHRSHSASAEMGLHNVSVTLTSGISDEPFVDALPLVLPSSPLKHTDEPMEEDTL